MPMPPYVYGFSKQALALIASYLSNRWQHVKINYTFSTWSGLESGGQQGSVLLPTLFKYLSWMIYFFLYSQWMFDL